MKRLRKEIVQAVGTSEPFPIFPSPVAFGKNRIGLDAPKTEDRLALWQGGNSRTALSPGCEKRCAWGWGWVPGAGGGCLGPGVGAWVSWNCLSYTDCGLQGPHPRLSFSRKLAGRRKLDSESQGTCGTPLCRTSTRDSGIQALAGDPRSPQAAGPQQAGDKHCSGFWGGG